MKNAALASAALLLLLGCAAAPRQTADHEEELRQMKDKLDSAEAAWGESIDDPYTEPELEKAYQEMQCLCRRLHRRKGGFATSAEKKLCEQVNYPFTIYFNKLQVTDLKEQLRAREKEGTVASEYMRRPSRENEQKLKGIFEQAYRYYVGRPYTWHRYYSKYIFQKSRLHHFRREFEKRDGEYLKAQTAGEPPEKVALARKRAEFAYRRLKEECVDNDLPFAGEVGPFYRSSSLDDYHEMVLEEKASATKRKERGLEKEVVIFVHGLGQGRGCWGDFPTLLADDDIADPAADRYFKVYVFSYDTVEDAKSVEGFKNELAGFIDDILEAERVEKVSLIGHSFGGVLSLKYLVSMLDCPQEGAGGTEESAGRVLSCYLDGPFRQRVGRFIGISPALSGSKVANINTGVFMKKEDLYRKRVPFLRGGVPFTGDQQVEELEIGSDVNLRSFERLDTERILDPLTLAAWAPDYRLPPEKRALLNSDEVKVLCVIGNPWYMLMLGRIENDNRFSPFSVMSYCANINQTFLVDEDASRDIGYQGAGVRYAGYNHFDMIGLDSREHPSYRYAASFLKDRLIPQIEDGTDRIRKFLTVLRFFPQGTDARLYPDSNFRPRPSIHYLPGGKLTLPAIRVTEIAGKKGSKNLTTGKGQWNGMTGAFFQEGSILSPKEPAVISYEISAPGYETKRVTIPVRAGQVTYAPYITLEKASDSEQD